MRSRIFSNLHLLKIGAILTLLGMIFSITFSTGKWKKWFEACSQQNVHLIQDRRHFHGVINCTTGLSSKPHQDTRNGAKFVLILTYMRSGSSLVGCILQEAKEAFYVFEPFRHMDRETKNKRNIEYMNGSSSVLPLNTDKVRNDAIYNWFTCNIQEISKKTLYDVFLDKAKKTTHMRKCLLRKSGLSNSTKDKICSDELRTMCLNSPIRIIKTIRTRLENASRLLEDLPNMKIIHLVRDPRATINSRKDMHVCREKAGGLTECTKQYCTELQEDVHNLDKLVNKYPCRIRTFFYEDVAIYPVETSRKIYDFVGESFTENIRNFVVRMTSSEKDNGKFGTYRSNSSEHVDHWKTEMSLDMRNHVQNQCGYFFKRYRDRYTVY